ncbi:MAG: DUF4175 family protein [Myxococcota bacterium]
MAQELNLILQFMRRLRQRAALLCALELLLLSVTGVSALLLVAAGLGGLGWVHQVLPPLFAGLALSLPLVWAWRVLRPRYMAYHHPHEAARSVDAGVAGMGNLTLSALELAPQAQTGGVFSTELIQATVSEAARRVSSLVPGSLVPLSPLKPWGISGLTSSALLGLMYLLLPTTMQANLQNFWSPPEPVSLADMLKPPVGDDGPALADITVELVYPAYLQRDTELLENASGEIRAPKGTQVKLSARAAFVPTQAQLLLEGLAPQVATVDEKGRFSASFTLESKSTWRFSLLETPSSKPFISRAYPIDIEEDGVPTVEITNLEPVTEVTVSEPLAIRYRTQDDHGLTRLVVVSEGAKKTLRKTVLEYPANIDRDENTFQFFPAEAEVPQGGSVEIWLEVHDDDTISGPKLGKSIRYRLTLASDEKRREQNLAGKEDLKEALLTALGDVLVIHDEPMRNKTTLSYVQEQQTLAQDMVKIRDGFTSVRRLMEEDRNEEVVIYRAVLALEKELIASWERLEEALKERSNAVGDGSARISALDLRNRRLAFLEGLENAVLSMESFANMARMESIMSRGEELKKSGQELRELLEQAKKSGKQPDLKAMMEKLQEMQQKLSKMAQEMQQLDRTSAEWYQNPAGETQEVKDSMDELQKLLEQGKVEEAAKLLEEYMKNTDELMQSLEKMQKEEFNNDRQSMTKDMAGVIEGIKEMEEQQKRLMNDTRATQEQVRQQAGLSPQSLEQQTRSALEKVEQMRQSLDSSEQALRQNNGGQLPQDAERRMRESRDQLNTLESALKVQDLNRSMNGASDTARSFRAMEMDATRQERMSGQNMQTAKQAAQEGRRAAESLQRELQELAEKLDESRQQAAAQGQGLAGRQQSLEQKGQGMGQRLQEYAKDSPVIPGKWGERLEQATRSMQAASGKLQSGELQGGVAEQQSVLQELGELRKEMEQTQKDMQQQARGVPRPQPSGQQPQQASAQPNGPGGETRENWGRSGNRVGEVDISKDYKAPEDYRREVMEGMKGDAPTRYKRLNREYYEKLVK